MGIVSHWFMPKNSASLDMHAPLTRRRARLGARRNQTPSTRRSLPSTPHLLSLRNSVPEQVSKDGKNFCCHGCLTVFELLAENGLDGFYEFGEAAAFGAAAVPARAASLISLMPPRFGSVWWIFLTSA